LKNSALRKILPELCKIFAVFLFFITPVFAQISPGDLTTAHAKYEGLSNCTKCHVLGKQVQVSKCLDCHTEIKKLIDENRGYHSSREVKGKDCWDCHSEHHGRNFRIVNFDKDKFDHEKAGFRLTGKHSEIECFDCHKPLFIQIPEAALRKNTLLGLSETCKSCHEDIHKGRLGDQCGSCHNTTSFNKVDNFDHSKTEYKLTGAHEKVSCTKCHPQEIINSKQVTKLTGIPFSSCESCHKDVHQGKFGKDCQSCHLTTNFRILNQKIFDHNKTNFPLIGKHKTVKCSKCHGENLNSKPRHQNCTDCHSDYHNGEFTTGAALKDCSVCHTEKGFKPSTFTIDEHNKIDFKLSGAHLAVPCRSCHFKTDKWHFKNIGLKCIDCHKNVHGSEITVKFMKNNNCEGCHIIDNWNTIHFDHSLTTFSLEGKHKDVSCGECHYKEEYTGKKIFRFVSLSSKCESCHKDVHYGQFNENGNSSCGRCHAFNNWKPDKFDHNRTRFSLEGAHQNLDCSKCHPVVTLDKNQFVKYKLKDFKCAACHS
jgi:nitrate/TMAO reductase-like tetraheme cytochrome c subunit